MKRSILCAVVTAIALSAPIVLAQDTKPVPGKPAAAMEMDKQMARMQEQMKRMQDQMDRIHKTTDPKARQKLMQEHMQTMQEGMKMMGGMGAGMKGGDRMAKARKDQPESMTDAGDGMQMCMMMMKKHEEMGKKDVYPEGKPETKK